MLTIKEVRKIAGKLKAEKFLRELGPFALIQRPVVMPGTDTQEMGLPMNARTTQLARPEKLTADVLSLIFEFDELIVATLPPMEEGGELSVGRAPDCDLVLDDASVSKRHASLKWSESQNACTLEDLGSTNGTHLNGSTRIRKTVSLRDGDIVSFGEVVFWYLLTPTLYERLKTGSGASKLRSHSG